MRLTRTSGSVGDLGGRPPRSTGPKSPRGGILSRLNQFRVAKRLKLDPTLACRPLAIGALIFGTIELADRDIFWYFPDQQALKAVPETGSGVRPLESRY